MGLFPCRSAVLVSIVAFLMGCGSSSSNQSSNQGNGSQALSISLNPTSVTAGDASTATITLAQAAPASGAVVMLSSSSGVAIVPASATVPAGSMTTTFPINTVASSTVAAAGITASYDGKQSATLTINPGPDIASISLNPTHVAAGGQSTATVTLAQAAPAGGVVVALSANSAVATVPHNVTVAAGSATATFGITAGATATGIPIAITASFANSQSANLVVNPVPLSLLNGSYAFSFSGLNQSQASTLFIAGSFSADGKGDITGGIEDLSEDFGQSISRNSNITGTYTIGSDGRGMLTFNINGSPQTFAFVVENGGHGQLIWFDNTATGSGTFDLQAKSAFTAGTLQGSWAFRAAGVDASGHTMESVGGFAFSSGSIQGLADQENAASGFAQSAVTGSFGAPDSNGHGTAILTFGAQSDTYAYDIVSASRILLIEFDGNAGSIGEADLQTSASLSASNFAGSYAFLLSGVDGNFGSNATFAGVFTPGANNTVNGEVTGCADGAAPSVGQTLTGSFTFTNSFSGTNFNGRGQITLALPGHSDTFVFYMISPSQAFVMESDFVQFTMGVFLTQSGGPFTAGSLTGDYGLQFSGDEGDVRVDFSGQFTADGTSALTNGTIDINNEDLSTQQFVFSNNPISNGSYKLVATGSGRGTLSFSVAGGSLSFVYYFVSPSELFLIETDQLFVSTGTALAQPLVP